MLKRKKEFGVVQLERTEVKKMVHKILVQNNVDLQKLRSLKNYSQNFGQNRVSNSWDYGYMDKCHLDMLSE